LEDASEGIPSLKRDDPLLKSEDENGSIGGKIKIQIKSLGRSEMLDPKEEKDEALEQELEKSP
jgi:hypothetical protein